MKHSGMLVLHSVLALVWLNLPLVPAVRNGPSAKSLSVSLSQTDKSTEAGKDHFLGKSNLTPLPLTGSNSDFPNSLNVTRDINSEAVARILQRGPNSLSPREWQTVPLPVLERLLQDRKNLHANSLGAVISAVLSPERSAFRLLEKIIQEADEQNRTLASRLNRPPILLPSRYEATDQLSENLDASALIGYLSEDGPDPDTLVMKSAFPKAPISKMNSRVWFETWLYKREAAEFNPAYGQALVRLFLSTIVHRQTSLRKLRAVLNTVDPLAPYIPLHSMAELNTMLPLPGQDAAFYQRICSTYPQSGLCHLMVYNSLFREDGDRGSWTIEPLALVFLDPLYVTELQKRGYISKTALQQIAGKYTSLPMSFLMAVRPLVTLYWNGTTPPIPYLPALDSQEFDSLSYQKLMKRPSDLGKVYHLLNPAQKHKLARLLAQGGDQVPAFVPNRLPARDYQKSRNRLIKDSCRTNVLENTLSGIDTNKSQLVFPRTKLASEKSCLALSSAVSCREIFAFNSSTFWAFLSKDPALSSTTSRCVQLKAKQLVTGNPHARDLHLLLSLQPDEFVLLKASLPTVDMASLQVFVQLTRKSGLCREFFAAVDGSAHLHLSYEKLTQFAQLAAKCFQRNRNELLPKNISAMRNLAAYLPVKMLDNLTVDAISAVFGKNPHAHPSLCRTAEEREGLRQLILRKFKDPSTWAEPHLYHQGCLVEALTDDDFTKINPSVRENMVDFWTACLYSANSLKKKTAECNASDQPRDDEDYPDVPQDERVAFAPSLESAVKTTLRQIALKESIIKGSNLTYETVTGTELLRGSPSFYDSAALSAVRYDELMNAMDAVSSVQLSTAEAGAMWGVIRCRWNHPRLVPGHVLRQLGSVSLGIPPEHMKQLNLNDTDVISSMSAVKGYTYEQIKALATAVLRRYRRRYPTDLFHMESLGQIICGFPEKYLRTALRSDILALASPAFFKALKVCRIGKLNIIALKVASQKSYGPVQSWTPDDVQVLGPVVAGIEPSLLKEVPPVSFQSLSPEVAGRFNPQQVKAVLAAAFYMQCDTVQTLNSVYPNALPELPQHCPFQGLLLPAPEPVLYDLQPKLPVDTSTGQSRPSDSQGLEVPDKVSTRIVASSTTPANLATQATEEASPVSRTYSVEVSSITTPTARAAPPTTVTSSKSSTAENLESLEHQMLWQQDSPVIGAQPLTLTEQSNEPKDDLPSSTSSLASQRFTSDVSSAAPDFSPVATTSPSPVSSRQTTPAHLSSQSSTPHESTSTPGYPSTSGSFPPAGSSSKSADLTTTSDIASVTSSLGLVSNTLSTTASETPSSLVSSQTTKNLTPSPDAGTAASLTLHAGGPSEPTAVASEIQQGDVTFQVSHSSPTGTSPSSISFLTEVTDAGIHPDTEQFLIPSSSTERSIAGSLSTGLVSKAPTDVGKFRNATEKTGTLTTDATQLRDDTSVNTVTMTAEPLTLETEGTLAMSATEWFSTEKSRLDFEEVGGDTTDAPVFSGYKTSTTVHSTSQSFEKASKATESSAPALTTTKPSAPDLTAPFTTLDAVHVTHEPGLPIKGETTYELYKTTQSSQKDGSKFSEETSVTVSFRTTTEKLEVETRPETSYELEKGNANATTVLLPAAVPITPSAAPSHYDHPTTADTHVTGTEAEDTTYPPQAALTTEGLENSTARPISMLSSTRVVQLEVTKYDEPATKAPDGSSSQYGHSTPRFLQITNVSTKVTELVPGVTTTRAPISSTSGLESEVSLPATPTEGETNPRTSPSSLSKAPEVISVDFTWVTEPLTTYSPIPSTRVPKTTTVASSEPSERYPGSSPVPDSLGNQTEDVRLPEQTAMESSSKVPVTSHTPETLATQDTTNGTTEPSQEIHLDTVTGTPETSHDTLGSTLAETSAGSTEADKITSSFPQKPIEAESGSSETSAAGLFFLPEGDSLLASAAPQEGIKVTTLTGASTVATHAPFGLGFSSTVADETTRRKRPNLFVAKTETVPHKGSTPVSFTTGRPSASPTSRASTKFSEPGSYPKTPLGLLEPVTSAGRAELSQLTGSTTVEPATEKPIGLMPGAQPEKAAPTQVTSAENPASVVITLPASSVEEAAEAHATDKSSTSSQSPEPSTTSAADLHPVTTLPVDTTGTAASWISSQSAGTVGTAAAILTSAESTIPAVRPEEPGKFPAAGIVDTTAPAISAQPTEATQDVTTRLPVMTVTVESIAREPLASDSLGGAGTTAAELRDSTFSATSIASVSLVSQSSSPDALETTGQTSSSPTPSIAGVVTSILSDRRETAGKFTTSFSSTRAATTVAVELLDSTIVPINATSAARFSESLTTDSLSTTEQTGAYQTTRTAGMVTAALPSTTRADELPDIDAYETTRLKTSSKSPESMESTTPKLTGKVETTVVTTTGFDSSETLKSGTHDTAEEYTTSAFSLGVTMHSAAGQLPNTTVAATRATQAEDSDETSSFKASESAIPVTSSQLPSTAEATGKISVQTTLAAPATTARRSIKPSVMGTLETTGPTSYPQSMETPDLPYTTVDETAEPPSSQSPTTIRTSDETPAKTAGGVPTTSASYANESPTVDHLDTAGVDVSTNVEISVPAVTSTLKSDDTLPSSRDRIVEPLRSSSLSPGVTITTTAEHTSAIPATTADDIDETTSYEGSEGLALTTPSYSPGTTGTASGASAKTTVTVPATSAWSSGKPSGVETLETTRVATSSKAFETVGTTVTKLTETTDVTNEESKTSFFSTGATITTPAEHPITTAADVPGTLAGDSVETLQFTASILELGTSSQSPGSTGTTGETPVTARVTDPVTAALQNGDISVTDSLNRTGLSSSSQSPMLLETTAAKLPESTEAGTFASAAVGSSETLTVSTQELGTKTSTTAEHLAVTITTVPASSADGSDETWPFKADKSTEMRMSSESPESTGVTSSAKLPVLVTVTTLATAVVGLDEIKTNDTAASRTTFQFAAKTTSADGIPVETVITTPAALDEDLAATVATEPDGSDILEVSQSPAQAKTTTSRLSEVTIGTTSTAKIFGETLSSDLGETDTSSFRSTAAVKTTTANLETIADATVPATSVEGFDVITTGDATEMTPLTTSQLTRQTSISAAVLGTISTTIGSSQIESVKTPATNLYGTTEPESSSHPAAAIATTAAETPVQTVATHKFVELTTSSHPSETVSASAGELPDHVLATIAVTSPDDTNEAVATAFSLSEGPKTSRSPIMSGTTAELPDNTSLATAFIRGSGTTLEDQTSTEAAVVISSFQPSEAMKSTTTRLPATTVAVTLNPSAGDGTLATHAYGTDDSRTSQQTPGTVKITAAGFSNQTSFTVPSTSSAEETLHVGSRSTASAEASLLPSQEEGIKVTEFETFTKISALTTLAVESNVTSTSRARETTQVATSSDLPESVETTAAEFSETAENTSPTAESSKTSAIHGREPTFSSLAPRLPGEIGTTTAELGNDTVATTASSSVVDTDSTIRTSQSSEAVVPARRPLLMTVQLRHPVTNKLVTIQGFEPVVFTQDGRCECTCPYNVATEDLATNGQNL